MSKASELLGALKSNAVLAENDGVYEEVKWIPHPSLGFNIATGGGVPYGRLIEFMGEYSSGKSLAAYELIAKAQAMGGLGVMVDAESVYDPSFGEKLGIDNEELIIYPAPEQNTKSKKEEDIKKDEIRKRSVEKVSSFLEDITMKCRKHYPYPLPVVLVVDSITALTTLKEAEDDMDTSNKDMTKAQKLGIMYGRLVGICKKENVTIVFINQMRERIQTGTAPLLGDKNKSTGGKGLEFYSSIRVKFEKAGYSDESWDIKGGKFLDENGIKIGQITRIEVVKNKLYSPFNKGDLKVSFDRFEGIYGFDRWFGLVGFLRNERLIDMKAGGHYSYGDVKLGQGEHKVLKMLKDNPEVLEEMFKKLDIKYED